MIFTTGNLLTLGIVLVALVLFRQLDRSNRSLEKLRKYGDRLREDLGAFVAEKESAVKDYAVELDVQRKAAKELLNRVASAEESFAQRVDGVVKIDERITAYDKALEDLMRMTARAQENLDRLKDEAAFSDSVLKRVKDAKEQLEKVERGLGDLEVRFERENAQNLERTAEAVVGAVRSTASDLQATAETIERRVEDHREAIVKIESARAAQLQKDEASIRAVYADALERSRVEADKVEDAAFAKLKEQAQDRAKRFHDAVEEKLGQFQEASKLRLAEVQGLVKNFKGDWQKEASELADKQKAFKDEWKRDYAELSALERGGREEWKQESAQIAAALAELQADFKRRAAAMDEAVKRVAEDAMAAAAEDAARRQGEIRSAVDTSIMVLTDRLSSESAKVEQGVRSVEAAASDLSKRLDAFRAEYAERLASAAEEVERKGLEETEARMEAYRAANAARFDRLSALADDAGRLDAELRRSMESVEARVRQDFSLFEKEAESARSAQLAEFAAAAGALKKDMDGVEAELNQLKARAYENVSEKLKVFEDDFFADLSRRSDDIDKRLDLWRAGLDESLDKLDAAALEQMKGLVAEQAAASSADLERLRERTGAFEDSLREQLSGADLSLQNFKDQLAVELEEARSSAAATTKAEVARHGLEMAELLKKDQRGLEETLRALLSSVEERKAETAERLDATRRELEAWQSTVTRQLRDADGAVEDARKRARDLAAESDERLAAFRASIDGVRDEASAHRTELFTRIEEQAKALDASVKDTDRRLKEFFNQTKLFDRADELKSQLERKIEDLGGDMDRLDQRRSEAAELEAQFVKIKRLEDEVNAKMTRFLSERHRIELMENDFKRLISTAQSVDERLAQVTASDDSLQAMQAQLRRLEEATKAAEDKFERLEKKEKLLDDTADGIDKNFKALRDAEAASKRFDDDLKRLGSNVGDLKSTLDKLAAGKDKAEEAADKLIGLDRTLSDIERRIEEMQTAREWLARTETRLSEVSKQAQEQVKIMGTLLKSEGAKGGSKDRGAPPMGVRETVVKLAHQGWSIDEIARAVKLSKGEVELILEISPKG